MDIRAAKKVLGACQYDPDARRSYDMLRGAFVWQDEFPPPSSLDCGLAIVTLAPVIAYRGSLTLGSPQPKLGESWRALREALPFWPGFRPERIHGQVERALKAAKLREARFFEKME